MVVPQAAINNIMGGIESTGGVRLHNHRRKLKQRFDIVRKLGQGNYGKVQLGINKETGQEVAIKTIKKCKIETEADLIRIRREIQIMSSVRHPNIIHIYEVFENREKMVLVMEYAAGGELYDFLDQKKVLTEDEARQIFRQISTAIYYCHKHKICHRDLKLENILLDENGNAKIADFGLSNVFTESRFLSTFCGSPLYASPEIVKGIPYHGPEVDCWSLGVLLYTLVYGAMPFDGSNFKRLVKQISNGDYFEPKNQSTASPLIAEMLNTDPASRADITFICTHWWIDKGQSVACLSEAEELANQTPVRLDLLLSLAPCPSAEKLVVGAEGVAGPRELSRPLRSQSLGNIPPIMEKLSENEAPNKGEEQESDSPPTAGAKRIEKSSSNLHKVKIDRSGSRTRKKEKEKPETDDQAQAKTANTLAEPLGLVQEPKTPTVDQPCPPSSDYQNYQVEELSVEAGDLALETLTPDSDPLVSQPVTPRPGDEGKALPEEGKKAGEEEPQKEKKAGEDPPQKERRGEEPQRERRGEEEPQKERRRSSVLETVEKFNKQPAAPPKKVIIPGTKAITGAPAKRKPSTVVAIPVSNASKKSLSDIPANTSALQRKTDAAFKREVEPSPSSPSSFCLASTVNVHIMAEKALSSPEVDTEVGQPPPMLKKAGEPEEDKVKNAVSVIGRALNESPDNLDKKFSSLPRKPKASTAPFIVPIKKPSGEFRSEIRHLVNSPPAVTQRTEVTFPVAAAPAPPAVEKTVVRQGNQSREHIIPIKLEQDVGAPPASQSPTQGGPSPSQGGPSPTQGGPIRKSSSQQSQQTVSRTSSRSLSRQSTGDSDSSICSSGDPIRKSAREVIIPIAVEGGGYITPSASALNRINSITESEDDASASGSHAPRCFTLRSTRRRLPSHTSSASNNNKTSLVETADSVSSDEDDDNFEILTAENLFSTLLSRVRSLTQRLNTDENKSAYPRSIFHHGSIFDNPGSRLSETRSFSRADLNHPWRRSLSREPHSGGSSSTLPRDRSKSSNRSIFNLSRHSSGDEKAPYRSRLRPPITIKNSLSKQLMKERLDELDGIDKLNETKMHPQSCNGNDNSSDYPVASMSRFNNSTPYVYKMRTRQRTNSIEADVENFKPGMYHMRTRNRSNSSELLNDTPEPSLLKSKRPISIHESMDCNSPVAKRIYQRSLSCDRNKVNAILRDSAKILKTNYDEPFSPAVQSFRRTSSLRQPDNSRIKDYRRSLSTNTTGYGEHSVLERYYPGASSPLSPSERMFSPTRRISALSSASMYEPSQHRDASGGKEYSNRIKSTIKSLRESSVGPESSIDSESNLIKRALSSESKKSIVESSSSLYRANSLKQNSTSSKNAYKDLISRIVNSQDSSVKKSISNDKKNLRLINDPVQGTSKSVDDRNSTEKTSPSTSDTTQKYDKEEKLQKNGSVEDRPISRISRFLRSSPNEKSADVSNKLTSRLNSNSEPILLRNRRYSIPRPKDIHNATNKQAIDTDENIYKYNDRNTTVAAKRVPESNGNLSEHEVDNEDVATTGSKDRTSETKDVDNSQVDRVKHNSEKSHETSKTISKLKRLDLSQIPPRESRKYERSSSVSKSLDKCESGAGRSVRSPTEESDGVSVGSDCPSPSSANEETISERVRRKSYFSRFNPLKNSSREKVSPPSRLSYVRSSSADNPNPSQYG